MTPTPEQQTPVALSPVTVPPECQRVVLSEHQF